LPERKEKVGQALGLDPVWGIEVVALGERLHREIGEDRGQPIRDPSVVVRATPAAKHEEHRTLERSQRVGVEVRGIERLDERAQTGGALRHPRRGRAVGSRRRFDTRCELQSDESGHELVGWQVFQCPELLDERVLFRRPLVPRPRRLE